MTAPSSLQPLDGSPQRKRRALLAALIGNTLEWYDFIVYGFIALYIAQQFFPPGDPTAALLSTFAAFSLSLIARPIGGVLIGMYADRRGRRPALVLVMGCMGVSMLIMVLTPTYAAIGIGATLIMIVARLLQSVSAGGEFASAATALLESVDRRQRGLYGGLYSAGPQLACLLSALAGLAITHGMSAQTRDDWGWRLPFALGLLIVPVGYYIRRHLPETEAFASSRSAAPPSAWAQLRELLTQHRMALLLALALSAVTNAEAYMLLVYVPTYVARTLGLPADVSFLVLLVTSAVGAVCAPLAGILADRLGALRLFYLSVVLTVLTVIPAYAWFTQHSGWHRLLLCAPVLAALTAMTAAVFPGLMVALFPANLRSTGMAVSYNLSAMLFGGFSLYFITVLLDRTGDSLVPAYYLTAVALACLACMATLYRHHAVHHH